MKDQNRKPYPCPDSKTLTSSTPRPVPNPVAVGSAGGKKSGVVKKTQKKY